MKHDPEFWRVVGGPMKFRPHKPGYVTGFDEPGAEFNTLEELTAIPQPSRFLANGAVLSFGKADRQEEEDFLMATMPDSRFWVVGYISPAGAVRDLLPEWDGGRPAPATL